MKKTLITVSAESRRVLFETSALPMWIHDPVSGRFLAANDAMISSYGWSREELLNLPLDAVVASSSDRHTLSSVTPPLTLVDGGRHRRKDGRNLLVEVSVQEIDFEGRRGCLVLAIDVTDRKGIEEMLMRSERQLSDAQQLAHVGSFEWEMATDTIHWSDELYRIYGLKPREFEATFAAFLERIHPDDREEVHKTIRKTVETGQPFQMEERIVSPDGTVRTLESRGHLIPDQGRLVGVCRDITDLREAEKARDSKEDELRQMSERIARTESFSLVMVAWVGLDGRWLKVPPTLCKLLGYDEQELLSMNVDEVTHSEDREDDRLHRQRILRGEIQSYDFEERAVRKEGSLVWLYLNRSGVYDSTGTLVCFITYLRDITERHLSEERIRHQALHDDLTGLANRVLFNDRLGQAVAHAHRHNGRLAAISIDLDDFKFVNDNFGHSFGDILIGEVAGRLKSALRQTDTIARLSGDEFAVIIEDLVSADQAHEIALKVRELLEEDFEVATRSVRVTACIGISIYPRDGHDAEMLFRSSESALNRAKEMGHDNIQLFDESMSARFRDRLQLEQELHWAVERQEIVAYYQPILRGKDRRIVGVEALARWNHPERGIVGPDQFIPLAEETRLIVPIGEYMLRTSCRDVQRWIKRGFDLRLSVNLSVRQFQEMTLLHTIDSILAETQLDPGRLELEVTETVAMQNANFTMNLLRDLRERGISIAIDDFGAGQSSLIYLRQFPINTIKIDKVFIGDILTDHTDAAIVRTVIDLAHTLGLAATAEGVEQEEQIRMLDGFGCDLLQGYLFSRPVPAAEMERFLEDWKA